MPCQSQSSLTSNLTMGQSPPHLHMWPMNRGIELQYITPIIPQTCDYTVCLQTNRYTFPHKLVGTGLF